MMNRTRCQGIVLFAALGWITTTAGTGAAVERPPNVVFILADDLGYGELGCYGQKIIRTPRVDRIAAEGMKFTRCYAGSNVCAPSRCALMTGRHTGHTPIRSNGAGQPLHDEDVTLGEVLERAGYDTGYFGKYGLGNEGTTGHPNRQGFGTFFGFLDHVHAHFFYPYFLWKDEGRFFLPETEGLRRARYSLDEVVREAKAFLRRDHGGRPFFLFLAPTTPHVELVVPEESSRPYRGLFEETPLPDPRAGYIGAEEPYATFAGMVSRMDDQVGQVLDLIEARGLDDDTIVFFTSDNGPQGNQWKRVADAFDGNGPLRGYKGEFHEGGIRVPLLVRWPKHVRAGAVSDHVCAFWDILPTLADLAGTRPTADTDGLSLAPTLLGRGDQAEHESLYWEIAAGNQAPTQRALLWEGRWKAVQPGKARPWELYDLATDPAEARDVAAEHADVLDRIKALADASRTPQRVYPPAVERAGVKDFVR
jgi:arylsulfatase A